METGWIERTFFEDAGRRIKKIAWILFIIDVLASIILASTFTSSVYPISSEDDLSFINWLIGFVVCVIVFYFITLNMYGLGELIMAATSSKQSLEEIKLQTLEENDVATSKKQAQSKVNAGSINTEEKRAQEQQAYEQRIREQWEQRAQEQRIREKKAEEERQLREEKRVKEEKPKESWTLIDHLKYALQYSTDDGKRQYLNKIKEKLNPEEQKTLVSLMNAPEAQIHTEIENYINAQ